MPLTTLDGVTWPANERYLVSLLRGIDLDSPTGGDINHQQLGGKLSFLNEGCPCPISMSFWNEECPTSMQFWNEECQHQCNSEMRSVQHQCHSEMKSVQHQVILKWRVSNIKSIWNEWCPTSMTWNKRCPIKILWPSLTCLTGIIPPFTWSLVATLSSTLIDARFVSFQPWIRHAIE